ANGLVCAHDVGANYGLPPTQDVCELPSNNPPVAFPDPLATPFETDLVLLNTTLMGNDEDPDPGDVVVWTLPQTLIADHGDITQTVLASGEVELRYAPPAGFSGTDRFSYLIEDNHGLPADQPGEVTIQVLVPANSPPEPMSDALLVPYLAIGIQVPQAYFLANDNDPDGDVLWISDLGSATHGGLKLDRGDVIFSPDASFWSAGADAFTYDVIDGSLTAQGLVNVAAEPVCDTYLGDDFETGDLAAWSQVVASSGGSVTADTAAAAEGVFGLAIDPASGTGFFYVEDDSPVNERHFRARLRFNTDDFTLPTGAEHSLLSGLVPGSNAFSLRLANSGGGPQLRLAVSRDNDSQALSAKVDIAADAWHRLFVDWWAATAPGSSDGGARLWLNGRLVAEILGVDNDGRAVDRVRLGAAAGLDAGSSGRYFFDAYASCDGGPGSRSSN
ncbi:MAG: Ig-like domain-containing protein, partial [Acidobacteriota bacterium]